MLPVYNTLYDRLNWAEGHIRQLDAAITAFLNPADPNNKPYNTVSEMHPDGLGNHIIRVKTEARFELPPEISLLAGNNIHDLRSVVDNAVWVLGRKHGASPAIAFPIAFEEKQFPLSPLFKTTNQRLVKAQEDLRKLPLQIQSIIQDLQPTRTKRCCQKVRAISVT